MARAGTVKRLLYNDTCTDILIDTMGDSDHQPGRWQGQVGVTEFLSFYAVGL